MMRNRKLLTVCVLVIALLVSLCACGNKSEVAADTKTAEETQADKQAAEEAVIQAQTNQQATAEVAVPTAAPTAKADDLLGSWIDVNSPDRFANITKVESSYQFEDNDGKYTGEFKDGVLKLKVSDTEGDTADVYLDSKTGHLFMSYNGDVTEFQKKQ